VTTTVSRHGAEMVTAIHMPKQDCCKEETVCQCFAEAGERKKFVNWGVSSIIALVISGFSI
jgi:hypothetical protein